MDISFYEVTGEIFERPVCQLIEKAYQTGKNTFVKVEDVNFQELINKTLWTFSQKSFIPHGSALDPFPEKQPVFISSTENNVNNSKILISVGSEYKDIKGFERVIIVFAHDSNFQKELCRSLYLKYKELYGGMKYYKQNIKGIWELSHGSKVTN